MEVVVDEAEKLLPGQHTLGEALAVALGSCNRAFNQSWDEIQGARKADWKRPDGSDWKFSWELEKQ